MGGFLFVLISIPISLWAGASVEALGLAGFRLSQSVNPLDTRPPYLTVREAGLLTIQTEVLTMSKPISVPALSTEILSLSRHCIEDCNIKINAIGALVQGAIALGNLPKEAELLLWMAADEIAYLAGRTERDFKTFQELVSSMEGK